MVTFPREGGGVEGGLTAVIGDSSFTGVLPKRPALTNIQVPYSISKFVYYVVTVGP